MIYVIELGSGDIIYILSFKTISSGAQKCLGGYRVHIQTHGEQCDVKNLLLLFKEGRLKIRIFLHSLLHLHAYLGGAMSSL
jgi:hypothetical protein